MPNSCLFNSENSKAQRNHLKRGSIVNRRQITKITTHFLPKQIYRSEHTFTVPHLSIYPRIAFSINKL